MSNNLIRVDHAALQEIAMTFDRESEGIKQAHESVVRHTDVLKNGGWTGDAADSHYREMDEDILPSLGRLVEALAAAGETTRLIATIMREAEAEAAACLRDESMMEQPPADGKDDGRRLKPASQDIVPPIIIDPNISSLFDGDGDEQALSQPTLTEADFEQASENYFSQQIDSAEDTEGVWGGTTQAQSVDAAANNAMLSSMITRGGSGGGIGLEEAIAIALLALLGGGLFAQAAAVASALAQEAFNRWQDGGFTLLPPARPGDNILDNPLDTVPPEEQEYIPLDDGLSDQMNAPLIDPLPDQQGIQILDQPIAEEQGITVLETSEWRRRYDQYRQANELAPLPDNWDVHHRIPRRVQSDGYTGFEDTDFHAPDNLNGVPGNRTDTNVHQQITNDWERWLDAHPPETTTREEIEAFAEYIDEKYSDAWWESGDSEE